MRDGWVETTLGDVAEWWSGGTPKAREPKYYENGTIPWAVIADMNKGIIDSTHSYITEDALDLIGGRLAPVGSVLISMYASVGKSAIANIPLATNQAIAWSIPNQERIIPFYLYLVSQQLEKEISDLARGATQRNINRQMLREFTFQLPPLSEQKRIVDLISSIDSYIEALQQQLESAKRSRNAVLHELLAAGGDDWVESKLGQYIYINTGKLDVNASSEFGEFPFFTCSRETYRIDEAAFEGESVIVAGNGDLNVKYYDGKFNAYQRTYVLNSLNKNVLDNQFLFLYMQTYIGYLRSETRGTVIQYLKKGQFTDASIVLPPLPEQKRIVELISEMDEFIESIQRTSIEAKNLRSGLLSDLLSGEHKIPFTYDKVIGAA